MSASSQALLDSITRQLCPPTSDAPGYENVVVGLSAHDGSILFTPHEGDSTFAKAFKAARPASAIKARTPVLSAILADTYPGTAQITVDRNTKLPILGSLSSAFKIPATRSAAIVRDEAALLVWCNDAERVAQRFLQVEHQLRHYARQCKCAAAPCSWEERSEPSTDAQLVLSHNHGYLFASQHDSSSSEELDVGSSSELSELDIPFRPLDVDDIMHDLQDDGSANITSDASYGITWDMFNAAPVSPWRSALPSSQLIPGRVFSSTYMMSVSATAQQEPQTVSPYMLHTPSTATTSTLSPASSSGFPVTPTSGNAGSFPSISTPSKGPGISPSSTLGVESISSPVKTLVAESESEDDDSVYDESERHQSRPASYTPQSAPHPLVASRPPSSSQGTATSSPSFPSSQLKRKGGRPSKAAQRQAASPSTRAILPLPRRSANRAVVEKSTTTRLHPLPGCNLRSLRSQAREPSPTPPSTTPPADERPCVSGPHDGDEDLPIDDDGSDEDDEAYKPSPKKACVDAESEREAEKGVTTKRKRGARSSAKGRKRGSKRKSRTACGSRRGHFPCAEASCDMVFTRETDMNRHVEWVHKKPGIRCPHCHKVYARTDSLKRHQDGGKCPKQPGSGQQNDCDEDEDKSDDMDDDDLDDLEEDD